MESNDELKEINIKNRACFYFNGIIKIENFDFSYTLIDKKSCENILVYKISYETLISAKPLRFRLDKTDGPIRAYDAYSLIQF